MATARTIRRLATISLITLAGGVALLVVAMGGLIFSLIAGTASCAPPQGCNPTLSGVGSFFFLALLGAVLLAGIGLLLFLSAEGLCLVTTVERREWSWFAGLGLPPLLGLVALTGGESLVPNMGLRFFVLIASLITTLVLILVYSRRLRMMPVANPVPMRER